MKIKNILWGTLVTLAFSGCLDNSFLDRTPKTELTEETLFTSNENFQTYAWQLYEVFPAYSNISNLFKVATDDFFKGGKGGESSWIWQKIKVPASGGGYDFSYVRKVNLLLDNVEKSKDLSENEKIHWRSVGKFFRAYQYSILLSKFGGVPWVDHCLNSDSEELYLPRNSRDEVAENILTDLQYAEENIDVKDDGPNSINADVVRALISRFTLFEGTWRKYHGLENSEKYLVECERVSKLLVEKYPTLHSNYDEVFNSVDLKGVDGILLYRQYVKDIVTQNVSTKFIGSGLGFELTKDLVDSYLCTDGKPIYAQADYPSIEEDPYTEFANRDKRLYYNVMLPYKLKTPGLKAFEKDWTYTDVPKDRIYLDLMNGMASEGFKTYPIKQNGGCVCKFSPHFKLHNGGFGFQATQGGYYPLKYYNTQEEYPVSRYSTDAPIFRAGEFYLNYAEACYENGTLTQEIVDQTINKLRERGGVAPLEIDAIFEDSRRDPDVAPLLWEIRRERRTELIGEGFRFEDLRRWKKAEYLNKWKLGRWYSAQQLVEDGALKNVSQCKIKFVDREGNINSTAGYITFVDDPIAEGYGWLDHYYLYPLPINNLLLNTEIEQNPGWE